MNTPSLVLKYTLDPGAQAPHRAHPNDAGLDLVVISFTQKAQYGLLCKHQQ